MRRREVGLAIGEDPPQVDLEPIDGEALCRVYRHAPGQAERQLRA